MATNDVPNVDGQKNKTVAQVRTDSGRCRGTMNNNDQLTTIVIPGTPEKGFRVPPPAGETAEEYAARAAGFVGDYRPLSERMAEKR